MTATHVKSAIDPIEQNLSGCPMHALPAEAAGLTLETELVFPLHKNVVVHRTTDEDGEPELRLYCGEKEIAFEEKLFEFGTTLALQSRFVAGSATGWGSGYGWSQVRELLEQLLEQGVLLTASQAAASPIPIIDGARPSPLPPAMATVPRAWDDARALSTDLTGRSLEPGHLEMVVPIFRIAHAVMDAEGRQVGEANVFPKALRLDVPTKWRTCLYAGSRHQSERPMNVTALKSMRAHWPQMMLALKQVRQLYLQRFPHARQGWTVGHLERLATTVLALPTYLLMRSVDPVRNGALHPVLSSLFRVTDGLRMTMHQMMFVPIGEPTLAADAPMTCAEVLAYAERNHSFHSEHGVCAGPQSMIEEFLHVLIDGQEPVQTGAIAVDATLQHAFEILDQAFDYGLLGLQAHAATFSLWPQMARTYVELAAITESWAAGGSPPVVMLRDRLRDRIARLEGGTYLASEAWRIAREAVYDDMHAQCAIGLGLPQPVLPLSARIAVGADAGRIVEGQVAALLQRRFESGSAHPGTHQAAIAAMAACLTGYLVKQQAILGIALDAQNRINHLLGRLAPRLAFEASQIDIHNLLQQPDERRLPYLDHDLGEALGMRFRVIEDSIDVTALDSET